jgi:hypothetical protein
MKISSNVVLATLLLCNLYGYYLIEKDIVGDEQFKQNPYLYSIPVGLIFLPLTILIIAVASLLPLFGLFQGKHFLNNFLWCKNGKCEPYPEFTFVCLVCYCIAFFTILFCLTKNK